jgi:hypothetical protein
MMNRLAAQRTFFLALVLSVREKRKAIRELLARKTWLLKNLILLSFGTLLKSL